MHGFAQRVLPLPAEPEALSQADQQKREASRRLAGDLWRVYQALPQERKALVRLKALIHPTIGKAPFLEVVRRAGLRSKDGKAYISITLNAELQGLQLRKVLDDTLNCAPEIMHAVAADTCADKGAAHLVGAAKATPRSEREQANRPSYRYLPPIDQDFPLFRHLRLAIYANDLVEFVRLYKLLEDATTGYMDGRPVTQFLASFPLDQRWLETLHPVIRDMFAERATRMLVEEGRADELKRHRSALRRRGVNRDQVEFPEAAPALRYSFRQFRAGPAAHRSPAGKRGAPRSGARSLDRVLDRR